MTSLFEGDANGHSHNIDNERYGRDGCIANPRWFELLTFVMVFKKCLDQRSSFVCRSLRRNRDALRMPGKGQNAGIRQKQLLALSMALISS